MPRIRIRRNARFALAAGYFLFATVFLTSCKKETTASGPAPLVVGMEMAYPPFEMRGPDNKPDGISVRMAEDLAEHLGRPLELRDTEWNGIIPALQTGKIDLIISSMTHTPERARQIAFSDGYVTNGLCMLVRKDSPIQSIADVKPGEHKLAVKVATTGHQWARKELAGVDLITLDESAACVLEVIQGKADAFIYDQISIYQFWKKYEDKTRPILNPIREETWAIGLRKDDSGLMEEVNQFLADYRSGGRFDELADRYMAEQKAAFEEMGVPFIFH
ncbi:MAG: transporter substrate-binding domain-containing protein [Verrucomicrobiales bacterium]|nr:transporter substrate-binding domain-containing protein [Verrucomicrobiales bacterium]